MGRLTCKIYKSEAGDQCGQQALFECDGCCRQVCQEHTTILVKARAFGMPARERSFCSICMEPIIAGKRKDLGVMSTEVEG